MFSHLILSKLWWTCLRESKSNLWDLCGCHLCHHVFRAQALGGGRGHGWSPLGRSPVDLVVEGLLHGGYFLLGINLNWKDLATLVLPHASSPHLLAYNFPRMLFPCLWSSNLPLPISLNFCPHLSLQSEQSRALPMLGCRENTHSPLVSQSPLGGSMVWRLFI